MQVLNRHHLEAWPDEAIYIGRGTALGNPYVIGEHGDRDAVCDQYATWLDYKIRQCDPVILTAMLGITEHAQLVCSCSPARCHGEEIMRAWASLQAQGLPPRPPSMAYAGIGSRKTPAAIIRRMQSAAERLATMGYTLRSGGAEGADSAFEAGAGGTAEIFLPWKGFNRRTSRYSEPSRDAMAVAMAVHPAWNRLSEPAKQLMARNSHQVLGHTLRSPVDFVVCWTPDGAEQESERSQDTGGTGQAIALASRWRIPVFNLQRKDAGERLLAHLKSAE